MYQDPSGHAGLFSKIVSAVKTTAKKVAKTVTKAATTVAKKVTTTVKKAATTVKKAVTTAAKKVTTAVKNTATKVATAAKKVTNTVKQVVNTAKQAVVKAATVVVNKVKQVTNTVIKTVTSTVKNIANKAQEIYYEVSEGYKEVKETVSRYVDNKVKEIKQEATQAWEDTKDAFEEGLTYVIEAKETVAEGIQQAAVWWEESSLSQKLSDTAENLCAAWNNSAIGKTVTAISTQVNKAAQCIGEKWDNSALGKFCDKAANSVKDFYEEHKTVINFIAGAAVIAACGAAVLALGPLGCSIWLTAAKGALIMSSVKAVTGAASGALDSATAYMEEYGTLDGSTSAILEGASVGYVKGAFSGAVEGAIAGAVKYKVKPKCFVAGTLVLTAIGLTCIEDIRPGDYVYAKNETTGEQEYMPVLETYINEIDTTYIVTIDGESIETTVGHPFYTTDKGWVGAGSLEVGDTVELSDGNSGEVESVEKNELDEPVTIYNINVMDYHTYYVGENEVLVHNVGDCDVKLDVDGGNVSEKWYQSTFDTVEDSMSYHLDKHGNGRTIEQYTQDALDFYSKSKNLGKDVILKDGTEALKIQTGTGKNKVGGYWKKDGKVITFWD